MQKILKVLALLLVIGITMTKAQVSVKFTVKNSDYKQAFFCSVSGLKLNVIGAKKMKANSVEFKFPSLPIGIYRIFMTDSAYVDFVVDRDKDIELETSSPMLTDSMKVLKGEDNKTYYNYLHFKNREIFKLATVLRIIKPETTKKQNPVAEERSSFVKGCVTFRIQQYADSIISRDSSLFVSKVIKAMLIPNLNLWQLNHPTIVKYNNDIEFLLVHFFDNLDFADSAMIHTEFLYRTVSYYIEKLAMPRNVTGFNIANDMILKKASANKSVYKYTLSLLFDIYAKTQLEDVFVKLFDDYLSKDTTMISSEKLAGYKNHIKLIKSLAKGQNAPDISGRDTTGKEINLGSVKSTITLLLLWTSGAKNSEDAVLQLNELYTKYKDYGLRIYAVALDTNEAQWKASLRKLKPEWTNVIDTLAFKGKIPKLYDTWSLPSLYIMDNKHVLAAKPLNVDYVKKEFDSAFKDKKAEK